MEDYVIKVPDKYYENLFLTKNMGTYYESLIFLENIFMGITYWNNGKFIPYSFVIDKASGSAFIERETGKIKILLDTMFSANLPKFPDMKFGISESMVRNIHKVLAYYVHNEMSGYNESKMMWNNITIPPKRFILKSKNNLEVSIMNHVDAYVTINDDYIKKLDYYDFVSVEKAVKDSSRQLDLPFDS